MDAKEAASELPAARWSVRDKKWGMGVQKDTVRQPDSKQRGAFRKERVAFFEILNGVGRQDRGVVVYSVVVSVPRKRVLPQVRRWW